LKRSPSLAALAVARLIQRTHGESASHAVSVREALRDAFVRLDWREARRQAGLLSAMGPGAAPLTEAERGALFAQFARLIAEAQARCGSRGSVS